MHGDHPALKAAGCLWVIAQTWLSLLEKAVSPLSSDLDCGSEAISGFPSLTFIKLFCFVPTLPISLRQILPKSNYL
jgi:hypothetical protein